MPKSLQRYMNNCHIRINKQLLQTVIVWVLAIGTLHGQDKPEVDSSKNSLTIVFAGDIMGHDSQIKSAYQDSCKCYVYEPVFKYIKDYISSADIAIGNLEVTLGGPPYKGYPQFSSPDALAIEAQKAGFDVMATANNHSMDRGSKGLARTIRVLDSIGLLHLGTYTGPDVKKAFHPLIMEKNNIKLALLNYTYGTNGLKVHPPQIVNYIDRSQIKTDLEKAEKAEVDFIIVFMHWGLEYQREESEKQRQLATFMFNNGADAIIGSHPHVVQPIKYYTFDWDTVRSYPVVYSLGNFVSNQRAQYKDGGIMAELHLSKGTQNNSIDSLLYMPYWVWRDDRKTGSVFHVLPIGKYEQDSTQINLSPSDYYKLNRFRTDTRQHLKDATESWFYMKPQD